MVVSRSRAILEAVPHSSPSAACLSAEAERVLLASMVGRLLSPALTLLYMLASSGMSPAVKEVLLAVTPQLGPLMEQLGPALKLLTPAQVILGWKRLWSVGLSCHPRSSRPLACAGGLQGRWYHFSDKPHHPPLAGCLYVCDGDDGGQLECLVERRVVKVETAMLESEHDYRNNTHEKVRQRHTRPWPPLGQAVVIG